MNSLAERLKGLRKAKGLSQAQLASLAGISQQAVNVIENGDIQRPRRLQELATALETTPEWLSFGVGTPPFPSGITPPPPSVTPPRPISPPCEYGGELVLQVLLYVENHLEKTGSRLKPPRKCELIRTICEILLAETPTLLANSAEHGQLNLERFLPMFRLVE
ncbi:MAG: helix-turn-helix transcriptional regulator [Magnetococcales bacterium]|nr:helix-turn-helix transcriptional regulator [Magnetococcales bacterium]